MPYLRLPVWDQLYDPSPTGTEDFYATQDCGEECVAMAIYYRRRLELRAEDIRLSIPGHARSGLTTAEDLLVALGLFLVRAERHTVNRVELRTFVKGELEKGRPVICLGRYVDGRTLHWVIVVGCGGGRVIYNDPWHGEEYRRPWSWFESLYAGDSVSVGGTV